MSRSGRISSPLLSKIIKLLITIAGKISQLSLDNYAALCRNKEEYVSVCIRVK